MTAFQVVEEEYDGKRSLQLRPIDCEGSRHLFCPINKRTGRPKIGSKCECGAQKWTAEADAQQALSARQHAIADAAADAAAETAEAQHPEPPTNDAVPF